MADTTLRYSGAPFNYDYLHRLLHTELRCINGVYYCTIRGLARLLEISPSSLLDARRQVNGTPMGTLLKVKECSVENLTQSLKPIAGFDFKLQPDSLQPNNKSCYLLPEPVIAQIIKYYAYDCPNKKPRAVQLDSLLSAIGVRTFFSKVIDTADTADTIITSGIEQLAVYKDVVNGQSLDDRASLISDIQSLVSCCSAEYKEKVLLTLLGIL